MTDAQRIKILWSALGTYYQRPIDDVTLGMYAEDVADVPVALVEQAMKQYRRDPKNRVVPLPAQIRALAQPESQPVSNKALSVDAAARIISAIKKYGWNNPEDARKYIGELGWEVVQRQGGWMAQCESTDPTGVLQAQWTKLAEAILESGIAARPPGLPSGKEQRQVSDGMARITDLLPKPEK